MISKSTFTRMLGGFLAGVLIAASLPAVALGQTGNEIKLDAVEIFLQEENVTMPRSTGTVVNDTTVIDAGVPESTVVYFLIGGNATAVDEVNGEWQIGNPPVYVYEAADGKTAIADAPVEGSPVRVVGKRTLGPGPIVAQHISRVDTAPTGAPLVSTALLFNGMVTAATDMMWTVSPAAGAPVDFSILMDAGPLGNGPTSIHDDVMEVLTLLPGGVGANVTVEYAIGSKAPTVATLAASSVTSAQATLNGDLSDLGGSASVQVDFEYGTSTAYGSATTPAQVTARGAFSVALSGLLPETTYHYRARAQGAAGQGSYTGADMTFTTSAIAAVAPSVTTAAATSIGLNGVTLNGTLNHPGTAASVSVSFEWGTTTAYGSTTPAQTLTAQSTFSAAISGLDPGTMYHFRAKAAGDGATLGNDVTFTTLPSFAGGGGTGSGGSGSGSGSVTTVALSGMSGDKSLTVDGSGKSGETVKLTSTGDGKKYFLDIPAGTVMKTASGAAITSLTFADPAVKPPAPQGKAIIAMEELGPAGATFNPPITVTFEFDPATLPAGASKNDLSISFWDGSKWLMLESTVDATNNTVSASVNHFTVFSVLAPAAAAPAAPTSRPPSTTVAPAQPAPTLTATPTTPVPPARTTQAPPSTTLPAAPVSSSSSNWMAIFGIIAAAAVVIAISVFFVRRRSSAS